MWSYLDKYHTALNADAVDWYPGSSSLRVAEDSRESRLSDLVACAQYQLFEDGPVPERKGGIVLLEAVDDVVAVACGGDVAASGKKLRVVDEVRDVPGILDMKWIKLASGL